MKITRMNLLVVTATAMLGTAWWFFFTNNLEDSHRETPAQSLSQTQETPHLPNLVPHGTANHFPPASNDSSVPPRLTNTDPPSMPDWLADDPVFSAALADSQTTKNFPEEVIRPAMIAWAKEDPLAALKWAETLPNERSAKFAMFQVCLAVSEHDPANAVDLARTFGLNGRIEGLMATLTAQWAERDLIAAYDWAKQVPPGEERDSSMARLAFTLSQADPEEAGRLVLENIPPGPAQTEALISVLHQWSLRDLESALAWVDTFARDSLYDRALNELEGTITWQLQTIQSNSLD